MQPIPARKISTLICLLVLSGLAASSVAANPDVPSWLDRFGDPPAWARPQMFFVWNGDADKERIGEMLRRYADAGLGGVFVHIYDENGFPSGFASGEVLAYLNQKELSSIANQFGRSHVLCESSGAGGTTSTRTICSPARRRANSPRSSPASEESRTSLL